MNLTVIVAGKTVKLDPRQVIGKGGEADVFDIGGNKALKLFKQPNHPDLAGQTIAQRAAKERLSAHQRKLQVFPPNLPSTVVVPEELARDTTGQIVGYTMPFLRGMEPLVRYSDRGFREQGVPPRTVIAILQGLRRTLEGIHQQKVVIGDFNDLNVLVQGDTAHLIDADSFQYGGFLCTMFTARFADPMLCNSQAVALVPDHSHTEDSDWYAYAVMLMQSLLYVDPYGGVYRPKDPANRIAHAVRPLKRITIFHPEVRYPKPALPIEVLPDDLLEFFIRTFEKDERGPISAALVENLRWARCSQCGFEHGRSTCPLCTVIPTTPVAQTVTVRGTVTAARLFFTDGIILHAALNGGHLQWLYYSAGEYRREDHKVVTRGPLDPQVRYRIQSRHTLMGRSRQLHVFGPTGREELHVDTVGTLPAFGANDAHRYWLANGRLWRDGPHAPVTIGEVLANQTQFWVGPQFGFGYYRAAALSVAFVFDVERLGMNDRVPLPAIRGQIVDSTCVFGHKLAWFFTATQESGRTVNSCVVVGQDGSVRASATAVEGDGTWLGTLRGKTAAGSILLAATDDGLVQVGQTAQGAIQVAKVFPDTESFMDSGSHLFAAGDGLYVVNRNSISKLRLAST